MKVVCKKCHKKFDEELYSYVCPKCGTYSKTARTDTRNAASVEERVKQDRSMEKSLYLPCVIVLLLLIVGMPLVMNPLSKKKLEEKKNERYLSDEVSTKSIEQGKWFSIEDSSYRYSVTIDEAYVVDPPEGINQDQYEMIEVTYHIGDEDSVVNQSYYMEGVKIEVSLATKSGEILESVSPYLIKDIYSDTDEDMERKMSASLQYSQGSIYYLVKKDDVKDLIITVYEKESGQYKVTGVQERFVLDELEVVRE